MIYNRKYHWTVRRDVQSGDPWVYVLPFFRSIFFGSIKMEYCWTQKNVRKPPGLSVTYLLHCPEIKTLIPIIYSYFMQVTNCSGKMRSFRRYKCSEVEILVENVIRGVSFLVRKRLSRRCLTC